MPHPITIHHDSSTLKKQHGITERPDFCNYPIRGVRWDTVQHPDYRMSLQQEGFFGNHLQLVEIEAATETTLSFTVGFPSVFIAVMMEGFVKFYKHDELIAYALGGVMYMAYCPRTDFLLQVNAGKHTLMVVSLEKEWFLEAEKSYPYFQKLFRAWIIESRKPVVLPHCRLTQPVADLWDNMRIIRPHPIMHQAMLVKNMAYLLDLYHAQLEKGNHLKGQLSVETANNIVMFVQSNYTHENRLSVAQTARHVGISTYKMEEYAQFLFGKSLHKHVRDLRMIKAAKLLRQTSWPVSDIAIRVGYMNIPHFYLIFQYYFNTTPHLYRQRENERE